MEATILLECQNKDNRVGGVMLNMLSSSAVDRGFEPRSGNSRGASGPVGPIWR
jgi:hypothetical protein